MALWTDPLAWGVVGLFLAAALAGRRDDRTARRVAVIAWTAFAGFWLALVPHFLITKLSVVEGIGSLLLVPLCLLVAVHLYRGRDSLLVATDAVAVMGAIYLPATTLPWLYRPLVDLTATQVAVVVETLGYAPMRRAGPAGISNKFVFTTGGEAYATLIVLACTGLGSLTAFTGVVAAVDAPLGRKLRALAVALPVIWVLNVARLTFISLAYGKQWFRGVAEQWIFRLFGASDPGTVSYLVADRLVAQSLSVVAVVIVFWFVLRELPELGVLVEDLAYLLTGTEYSARELLPHGGRLADAGPPDTTRPTDGDH